MKNNNYTMQVHTIRTDETTGDGHLILEVDGKLSRKAKKEITSQIITGRVKVRERVRQPA